MSAARRGRDKSNQSKTPDGPRTRGRNATESESDDSTSSDLPLRALGTETDPEKKFDDAEETIEVISKEQVAGGLSFNENDIHKVSDVLVAKNNPRPYPQFSTRPVPMSELFQYGYLPLIDRVHYDELHREKSYLKTQKMALPDFRRISIHILASMHKEVLAGLACGDLAKRHCEGDSVLEELYGEPTSHENTNWLKNAEGESPCIYARTLVNQAGSPPTPEEKVQIVTILRQYLSRDEAYIDTASRIDAKLPRFSGRNSHTHEDIKNGIRAYLSADGCRIQTRVDRAELFCDAVENLCTSVNRLPIAYAAWYYIGWSIVPNDRIDQHDKGKSSYLMELLKRIAELLFPGRFHLDSFIVAYLASEEESSVAEVLLTGISAGYYDLGTGMCIHPAGQNNNSARMEGISKGNADRLWDRCREFREEETPYIENMEKHALKMEEGLKWHKEQEEKRRNELIELKRRVRDAMPDYKPVVERLAARIEDVKRRSKRLGAAGPILEAEFTKLHELAATNAAEIEGICSTKSPR